MKKGGADRSDSDDPAERPGASARGLGRALAQLVGDDEPLLVGVSGGSDSVALLGQLLERHRGPVAVAHVDHGVRPGSRADACFVADLARDLGCPCHQLAPPPPAVVSETSLRGQRLGALQTLRAQLGVRPLLLAQHVDDSRETVLLHALRGHRGLRARAGMPAARPLPGGGVLLRPWLWGPGPDRAAARTWREQAGLPCVEDPTNADRSVPRNAVRVLLARDEPPITAAAVDRVRRRARRRLDRLLGAAVEVLAGSLRAEGRGLRVEARAWQPPPEIGPDVLGWRAELLRLLGASLEPCWRPSLRRGVLVSLAERLDAQPPRGRLSLPGQPGALHGSLSAAGLHLPGARLLPGDGVARGLAALARLPVP